MEVKVSYELYVLKKTEYEWMWKKKKGGRTKFKQWKRSTVCWRLCPRFIWRRRRSQFSWSNTRYTLVWSFLTSIYFSWTINDRDLPFCLCLKNFRLCAKRDRKDRFSFGFTLHIMWWGGVNELCYLGSAHSPLVAFVWFVSWYLSVQRRPAVHLLMLPHWCWRTNTHEWFVAFWNYPDYCPHRPTHPLLLKVLAASKCHAEEWATQLPQCDLRCSHVCAPTTIQQVLVCLLIAVCERWGGLSSDVQRLFNVWGNSPLPALLASTTGDGASCWATVRGSVAETQC